MSDSRSGSSDVALRVASWPCVAILVALFLMAVLRAGADYALAAGVVSDMTNDLVRHATSVALVFAALFVVWRTLDFPIVKYGLVLGAPLLLFSYGLEFARDAGLFAALRTELWVIEVATEELAFSAVFASFFFSVLSLSRAESGRQQAEQLLTFLSESTSSSVGNDFFRSLVVNLGRILQVRYVFIAQQSPTDAKTIQSIAFCQHGELADNFDCDVRDGPCEEVVVGHRVTFYPRRVRELFPKNDTLAQLEAESYFGLPLIARSGEFLGHLCIMDDKAIESDPSELSPLRIFAARAGAELERLRSDVTLRETENQLRHVQKVEALGRVAGGVAHDFNNFLTVINSYSEVIRKKLPEGDPIHEYADNIRKAGERASTLTRQLLAFSRKQVLELKVLDLESIVTQTAEMLSTLVGDQIEVALHVKPDKYFVQADADQLVQVLVNLAVNARDAMPRGGQLTIDATSLEVEDGMSQRVDLVPGSYTILAVTDTGCGVKPEILSKLFEPFFTTKEPGAGTGLGLSTAYGIVRQLGGDIAVTSVPGEGATFSVILPRVEKTTNAGAGGASPSDQLKGSETILLVEDDELVRTVIQETLRASGYTVLVAEHPDAALKLVAAEDCRVDLLLTDVVMPGMTGVRLAKRLESELSEFDVLYISGYTADSVAQFGIEPTNHFLQKPFLPGALIKKVRDVLAAPVRQEAPTSS